MLGYYCLLFSQVSACCLYSPFSLHLIIMLTASNAKMTFRESYNWGIAVWNRSSVFLLPCSLIWQNDSTVLQGSPLLSLGLCLYVRFLVTSSDFILIVSSELPVSPGHRLSTQTYRQQFDRHEIVSGIKFSFIPRWKPLY